MKLKYFFFSTLSIFLFSCNNTEGKNYGKDKDVVSTEFTTNNWVYTDKYGRSVASYQEAGPKREKKVGVFYYLWHTGNNPQGTNVTDYMQDHPNSINSLTPGTGYYWGQPEDGYYSSTDPWIIKKHLRMLSAADVDFLYFDATNGVSYLDVVEKLCEVSMELRNEGIQTPQIVFTTNLDQQKQIKDIYEKFYKPGKFSELWFRWNGKPVMLAPKTAAYNSEIANFFTWRYGWSSWGEALKDSWCWFNVGGYGYSDNPAKAEQVVVSKGSHPTINVGSSYQLGPEGKIAGGHQPSINDRYTCAETGRGDLFEKQWDKVFTLDPEVVMITQWNEWTAVCCSRRYCIEIWKNPGMTNETFLGNTLGYDDRYFVDMFNIEYNRDIEPMKGGYGDIYYYRMINYIRKFKGMNSPTPPSRPKTIAIDGNFSEWMSVLPIFTDYEGDTNHRNFLSGGAQVSNTTGRNDIVYSRVAKDKNNLYMYVKTADLLTDYTNKNWMLLFLDTDQNKMTGWEGYEFVINAEIKNEKTTTLKKWNGSSWEQFAEIPYRVSGNEMELSIPLADINIDPSKVSLNFHWADNMQKTDDVTEFNVSGDSAPDRQFDYHYEN